MYFESRSDAGKKLAAELEKYRYEDTAVLALSPGGVVAGAQIAAKVHCPLMFLLLRDIKLPGENTVLGVVDNNGGFSYNELFSAGQLEEFTGEYHNYIDQQKFDETNDLHRVLSDGGLIDPSILRDRNVILVSDGLINGMSLTAAMGFLKPINVRKVVVATPLASVPAVDRMHLLADELHVLSVVDGTFELNHYYEKDDVPSEEAIVEILNKAILQWK